MSDSTLPVVVAFCSQKGGVGKSTLARALAAAAAKDKGVRVRIIDVDELQETAHAWAERRAKLGLTPSITVAVASRIDNLRSLAGDADVLIIDAPGRASRETLIIAQQAHLVVQPTAGSSDDLLPGIALYRELIEEGISPRRLIWALSRVDSEVEERDLRHFLEGEGWRVLKGCLFNRSAYKRAMDAGYSVTETPFPTLNKKAAALIESLHEALRLAIIDIHDDLQGRKAGKKEMAA